jgi:hypothetical protein
VTFELSVAGLWQICAYDAKGQYIKGGVFGFAMQRSGVRSSFGHQYPKSQPSSVGIFFAAPMLGAPKKPPEGGCWRWARRVFFYKTDAPMTTLFPVEAKLSVR